MNKLIQRTLPLILLVILFSNCRKKAFDDYYGRPENLEPPIYQQLDAKGNFKSLLAAIDKAGYKSTLASAGYWTLFAPHDSAFQVYFASKGISGIDQLDSAACRQIVTYCLVYNAYKLERLDDYQAPAIGWVPGAAFKRRTAYYTWVYDGADTSGKPIKVVAANRNGVNSPAPYVESDNNYKYIPYFTDEYMRGKNLTAADYNYFYPKTPYTGFNVVDAVVTERDLPAENGVIHVVNKVITALPSIDQFLATKPQYSLFKSLFDKYLVQYVLNAAITQRYRNATGSSADIYTKAYRAVSGGLAFALNNENYLNSGNDAQTDGYTLFAPTNDVLQKYISEVLLEHYPAGSTLDVLGPTNPIIYDFINAHMWQKAVWPTKFASTFSFTNEPARFDPAVDVVDKQVLSNGLFYGTSKVQDANVFNSVYGRAYLDPKYSIMKKLLDYELKFAVSNVGRTFTLFMISDAMFNAAGFTIDQTVSVVEQEQYRFTPRTGSLLPASTGATTRNRLLRILNLHVLEHSQPSKVLTLANIAGEGAALSIGGEYIGYKSNTLFASGNLDSNNVVKVLASKMTRNGPVYYIDRMLNFTENILGVQIEKYGTPTTSQYNFFWQFLKGSTLWNATTKDITGIANGTFYTLFVPNNAAITNAVKDGILPGNRTTGVPNFLATTQTPAEKILVNNFIFYHFLDKKTIAADGEESGAIPTVLKNGVGDPTTIFVNNTTPGTLLLTDMFSRTAKVVSTPSTYVANRAFIHLIDNYLKYSL